LNQLDQVGQSFNRKQGDQIILGGVSREINYDFLLIRSNELVFEFAEYFQEFQIQGLFRRLERCFFRRLNDLSQNFGNIERKELFVVLKHFVNEQANEWVFVDISKEEF